MKLDITPLEKACISLREAIIDAEDQYFIASLKKSQRRLIVAGVIQNFEFTYELTYKMLQRQLKIDSANPSEVSQYSFRDLLRTAAEKGLISDVELWFEFRKQRNITSHTYDEDKAASVYATALNFQHEANFILSKLKARND